MLHEGGEGGGGGGGAGKGASKSTVGAARAGSRNPKAAKFPSGEEGGEAVVLEGRSVREAPAGEQGYDSSGDELLPVAEEEEDADDADDGLTVCRASSARAPKELEAELQEDEATREIWAAAKAVQKAGVAVDRTLFGWRIWIEYRDDGGDNSRKKRGDIYFQRQRLEADAAVSEATSPASDAAYPFRHQRTDGEAAPRGASKPPSATLSDPTHRRVRSFGQLYTILKRDLQVHTPCTRHAHAMHIPCLGGRGAAR